MGGPVSGRGKQGLKKAGQAGRKPERTEADHERLQELLLNLSLRAQNHFSIVHTARLLALVNLDMADAIIGCGARNMRTASGDPLRRSNSAIRTGMTPQQPTQPGLHSS
jgi:hypothetical protein